MRLAVGLALCAALLAVALSQWFQQQQPAINNTVNNEECGRQLSLRLQQFALFATDAPAFPINATSHPARATARRDLRELLQLLTNGTQLSAEAPHESNANSDETPFEIAFNALLRVAVRDTAVCRDASVDSVRMLAAKARFAKQFAYVDRLRRHFVRPRVETLRTRNTDVQRDVVVVGAGPLGLAAALDAYRRGANVRAVVEKRTNYTRNIWLDLYAAPHSRALDWWQHVGADILELERVKHPDAPNTITVRALHLERALAHALDALGIDILYGRIAVGLCRDADGAAFLASVDDAALTKPLPSEFAMCRSESWAPLAAPLPFDVLVAADGASSDVRRIAGLATVRQEHFSIGGEALDVPHLHQTTTIVDFVARRGICPALAEDVNGTVHDARYPGFVLKSVSTVFKRFYRSHCHLQIMWSLDRGGQMMRDVRLNNGTLPWDEILAVTSVLFASPPANVTALQEMVLNVNMFNVVIDAAPRNTLLWDEAPKHKPAIVTLVGDALVTAHYRLGIGINNGLSSLDELGELIHSLSLTGGALSATTAAAAVRGKQSATEKRVNRMLQFMLTVMFLETYCDDLLIYFDTSTADMWSNVLVYKKQEGYNVTAGVPPNYYESGPLKLEAIKKQCGSYWRQKVIET